MVLTNLETMYAPIHASPISYTLCSDASNIGWGVAYKSYRTGGAWLREEQVLHINAKEMIAIHYVLRCFSKFLTGKHVRILSDNTTAVSVINNMGTSHSYECNSIAQNIWSFCRQQQIWITCAHIPGSENVIPDLGSRKTYKHAEWMLSRKLYEKAVKCFNFKPNIDCFASRVNCQHWNYVSYRPDPFASHIDAFTINWKDFNNNIFPPFSLVGKVLQKLRTDKATALCVLPYWPTQTWWPHMNSMMIKKPIVLQPSTKNLLLPNYPQENHPLH